MSLTEEEINSRDILQYFTPSALGLVLWFGLSVGIIASIFIPALYRASGLDSVIREASVTGEQNLLMSYQYVQYRLESSTVLAAAGVFVFWALIGLAIYYIFYGLAVGAREVRIIKDSLEYVNAQKRDIYSSVVQKIIIRLLAIVALFGFFKIFIDFILPYALAATSAASDMQLQDIAYLLVSASILFVSFYIFTIIIRLILLRPRIFRNTLRMM